MSDSEQRSEYIPRGKFQVATIHADLGLAMKTHNQSANQDLLGILSTNPTLKICNRDSAEKIHV